MSFESSTVLLFPRREVKARSLPEHCHGAAPTIAPCRTGSTQRQRQRGSKAFIIGVGAVAQHVGLDLRPYAGPCGAEEDPKNHQPKLSRIFPVNCAESGKHLVILPRDKR